MIDVSELMDDPDFATAYTVHRSYGAWRKGRFVIEKEDVLSYFGVVQIASPEDLEQFPEGDRQKEIMKFFCSPPKMLYTTDNEADEGSNEIIISDKIIYDNSTYKIMRVAPWKQNGFIRAFGYKVGGVT